MELKRIKASIYIQKNIRMYIDKVKYKFILSKVNTIIFWYKYCKFSTKRKSVIKIQRFFRHTKERIKLKEKTIMQRRWEIMSEKFEEQEEKRKMKMEEMESNHKLEMEKIKKEREDQEKLLKDRLLVRSKKEE